MASSNSTLTQVRLQELLHYDPETGIFTWRVNRSYNAMSGDVAGAHNNKGYVIISIDCKRYRANRLAFVYMVGAWPEYDADHRDGVHDNNRWTNLRDATRIVNMQNQRQARAGSKVGVIGVSADKGKFRAQICVNKKRMHIGNFDTAEAAHSAYLTAKRQLHPGCTI